MLIVIGASVVIGLFVALLALLGVSGMDNVHIMFVVDDYESGHKTDAHIELSRFSYSEFDSGSSIKSSQLDGRKQNLDPRNLMARGGD